MTIEELIKDLHDKAKLLPNGLKTPLFKIEVDNVVTSSGIIYPTTMPPDIHFYRDINGDVSLVFHGC